MGAGHSARWADALATWRAWPLALTGAPVPVECVAGGLTNVNVRLNAPGLQHDLLLRLNHLQSVRLGIDRALERETVAIMADAGLARPALYWDTDHRFTVFPWLDARTWTQEDFEDPGQRLRLRPVLDRLRNVSAHRPRRRYHAYLSAYWRELQAGGGVDGELRAAWRDFEPELRTFDRADWPACWVHHDLNPANVLDAGDRLVLIDWEYAAVGHPDIDRWTVDPAARVDPFVIELMGWIDRLWARLNPGSIVSSRRFGNASPEGI